MTEEQKNLFEYDANLQASPSEDTVVETEKPQQIIEYDDFEDNVAEYTHTTIQEPDEFPKEGKWLTIESVEVSKIKPGEEPNVNNIGKSYVKKLIVNFEEKLNEDDVLKLRSIMPKVYLNERNGKWVPKIPEACFEEDLDDQYTSEVAKFRRIFYTSFPDLEFVEQNGKTRPQTSKEFVTSLIGRKVLMEKKVFNYKDQNTGGKIKVAKLIPKEFK